MRPISFKRHRFPSEIIRHAIWLYARFTLSFRDVEELLAERGSDASYETVRRWFLKFGPSIAANIRRSRPRPSDHWHLADTTPRTAAVQITRLSPTFPRHPCRHIRRICHQRHLLCRPHFKELRAGSFRTWAGDVAH